MVKIDFPSNPAEDDKFTDGNGAKWIFKRLRWFKSDGGVDSGGGTLAQFNIKAKYKTDDVVRFKNRYYIATANTTPADLHPGVPPVPGGVGNKWTDITPYDFLEELMNVKTVDPATAYGPDGYLTYNVVNKEWEFRDVRDRYRAVTDVTDRDKIPVANLVEGSMAYVQDVDKLFLWDGTKWTDFLSTVKSATPYTLIYKDKVGGQSIFPLSTLDINGQKHTLDSTHPEVVQVYVKDKRLLPGVDFTINAITNEVTLMVPAAKDDLVTIDILEPGLPLKPLDVLDLIFMVQ